MLSGVVALKSPSELVYFSLRHPFKYALIQFQSQSIVDGREFKKNRIHVCHRGLAFSNGAYF